MELSQQTGQKLNILCFSNQLWDFDNWTNKRLVMQRLAEQGHNIVFVDPPINFGFLFLRQFLRKKWSVSKAINWLKKDKCGAHIVTPVNFDPFYIFTHLINIFVLKKLTNKFFDKKAKTVLWVYHVQLRKLSEYIKSIHHDVLIYDCVDNYPAFPTEKSFFRANVYGQELIDQEIALAKTADIVFTTAPGLFDRMKLLNSNTFYTPNVGDYERFKDTKNFANKIPSELKEIPSPRIGWVGAIDSYKFDAKLVEKCVKDYPNYSFVLIGPLGLKDKNASLADLGLDKYKNVFYLGSRPYDKKKYYLAGFDVELHPYQLNDYTIGGCFPVKFHDSLAAGLPIVATALPAYTPFGVVCYISKNYDEFSNNIKKALDEDSQEEILARQKVAKENTWDKKAENMLEIIYEHI